MTEEQRKRHFRVLVEKLYKDLQTIAEGTIPDKKQMATRIIYNFYEDYKKDYKIQNIEEVIKELDNLNANMKNFHDEENEI